MTAKARVLDWLERADFNHHGCRHSQQTIALAVGCCRRTVIRALCDLEQEGLITVERPRRRGHCNTYRVRDWNPHLRAPVLRTLRRVRRLRDAECHTKGNSTSSRAHLPAEPSQRKPTALVARAREAQNHPGRSMQAEPAAVQHLRVVKCQDCERLQSALDAAILDLDNANTDLTAKRRQIRQLKNLLDDKHRSDPLYATAETIFFFWREKCQPGARTFSTDRVAAVLARLKDRDPKDPDRAAYSPRYICEAVLGAARDPYVDPKGKRHNDLELICRSGRKLEDFHERYERSRAKRTGLA